MIADFQRYLTSQGCEYEPLTEINITGWALKIINRKNQRRHYFNTYSGSELSEKQIVTVCDALLLKYPPHLSHLIK